MQQMKTMKKTALNYDNISEYIYCGIFEDLNYNLQEILKNEYWVNEENLEELEGVKIYGDLSYTQGRGLYIESSFSQEFVENLLNMKIKDWWEVVGYLAGGRSNYAVYDIEYFADDNDDDFLAIDADGNKYDEIESFWEERWEEIFSKLMKIWEEYVEDRENESIARYAFDEWKEINRVESDLEIYDFDYSFKEKEGYFQISEKWNTYIDWLWIKLELEEKWRMEKYYIVKD